MDILIQNTGATPLFMTLLSNEQGTKGIAGRISIEGDNAITKVPEALYESKIKNNPFFKQRIETGVLIILNDRQVGGAVEASASTNELGYARYKNLMFTVKAQGGNDNSELAPYLDREGMPKLDLVRSNMGQVEPQKIHEYRARFIAEQGSALGTLQLPSNKKMSDGVPVTSAELKALANKVASDKAIADKVAQDELNAKSTEANEDEDGVIYTQEELAEMPREELIALATDFGLEFGVRISGAKLIEKILEFQATDKE